MIKTKLRMAHIFVPGGFPNITYISRDAHQLESRVQAARDNLCKLVVVTGTTKSGKTVLVDKIFPQSSSIWINGGTISDEQSFWDSIIDELSLFTDVEQTEGTSLGGSVDGSITAGATAIVAKASAEITGSVRGSSNKATTYRRTVNTKVIAVKALAEQCIPVIVDDFHYINKTVQKAIVRALKAPIMHGLPVIFIAIPNRKYDAVEVEREMTGRIENIEMPVWSAQELADIAHVGFRTLNVEIDSKTINALAEAAYGSPFLMQEFCKELCIQTNIEEECDPPVHIPRSINTTNIFKNIAEHSGRSMFDKLKRGPRARSDRKQRILKSGVTMDIYGVVMEALKNLRPGVESISYEHLRTNIRKILNEEPPQKHEVSRVLDKIAEISFSDSSSTPVIDWQSEDGILTVTDPFFAFFLKWS